MKANRNTSGEITEVFITSAEFVGMVRKLLNKVGETYAPDFDVILRFETGDFPLSDPTQKGARYAERTSEAVSDGNRNESREARADNAGVSPLPRENPVQSVINLGGK